MGRKRKMLRVLLSMVFVLTVVVGLVGCGEQQPGNDVESRGGGGQNLVDADASTSAFQIDPLTITPTEAATGQKIAISTTLRNVGNGTGVYTAQLVIDGHVVESKDVTVQSRGSQALNFTLSRTEPGIYDVSLGGRSGSFAVVAPYTAPAFALDPLTISPTEALSGDEVTISTTLWNDGNGAGVYAAALIVNGHTVETKDVGVSGGGSVPLSFTVSETEAGVYDVSIGDRLGSFSVTTPAIAAVFQLDPLTVTPAEAYSDDNFTINTTVRNVGNADGVYTATLVIEGHAIETRDVALPSGGSQAITYIVSRSEPGTYDVSIGERSGSFTVSHPPLTLALDYMGVECADPKGTTGRGNIRLLILVADGALANGDSPVWVPLEGADAFAVTNYSVTHVGRQLFHTDSVGDYLRVMFVAYRENQKAPIARFWEAMGAFIGTCFAQPALGQTLGSLIDAELANDPEYTYVGSYQATWTPDQGWGSIYQYPGVGDDDLRLWFRIWTTSEPQEVAPPVLANVTIQDVALPSLAETSTDYPFDVALRNNESHGVEVTLVEDRWLGSTPVNQGMVVGTYTVRANSTFTVTRKAKFAPAGSLTTMTYTVLKDGNQVCSASKAVEARDRFNGWYDANGQAVTVATEYDTVTARVNMFTLAPGQYTMRIRRDISYGGDETVASVSFYFNGATNIQELSFVPKAKGGYHVDLYKGGTAIWTQLNTFPPRLWVYAFLVY